MNCSEILETGSGPMLEKDSDIEKLPDTRRN
jgi:hypothetical protein